MHDDSFLKKRLPAITEINRAYLSLIREMSAANLDATITISGLSREVVTRLNELTPSELSAVAAVPSAFFVPRLTLRSIDYAISLPGHAGALVSATAVSTASSLSEGGDA